MVIFEINAKSMLAVVMKRRAAHHLVLDLESTTFSDVERFSHRLAAQSHVGSRDAEQLADIMAQPATKPVHLNLPESLAGPEQMLDPTIEIHLVPHPAMSGMEVGLRVACDATEDQPVLVQSLPNFASPPPWDDPIGPAIFLKNKSMPRKSHACSRSTNGRTMARSPGSPIRMTWHCS